VPRRIPFAPVDVFCPQEKKSGTALGRQGGTNEIRSNIVQWASMEISELDHSLFAPRAGQAHEDASEQLRYDDLDVRFFS
jgi:hypothetical protein